MAFHEILRDSNRNRQKKKKTKCNRNSIFALNLKVKKFSQASVNV